MKQTGMLVVSLRGVNFGFWSRLGCFGESPNILSRQGSATGYAMEGSHDQLTQTRPQFRYLIRCVR